MPDRWPDGRLTRTAIGVTAVFSAALLATRLWAVWLSPLASDGAIFLAVGRAILNGLHPYRDLFETKPPGIFLLASLSQIFGGAGAAKAFSVLAILTVLASCLWVDRTFGFFAGTLLALLTAIGSGGFYPEEFGAAALCVYVAAVAGNPTGRWTPCVAIAALWVALLFKEPFMLAALAVAILLLRERRTFVRLYVLPQVVAVVLFAVTLASLGILREYFTLYLPFMFGVRVGGAENTGLWMMARDLFWFSPIFLPLILACGAREAARLGLLRVGAAILLLVAACLLGKYSGYHGTTAVPVYMAMIMGSRREGWALPAVLAAVLAVPLASGLNPPASQNPGWTEDREIAHAIDGILDRCSLGRYYNLGGPSYVYGFTRHSPTGPLLYLELFMLQDPYLVSQTLANLKGTDLILFQNKASALHIEKEYYDLAEVEVAKSFQTNPWPCAEQSIRSDRFILLFRKGAR